MRKFKDYIFTNIRHIIYITLGSVFFSFLVFPFLINLEAIKNFLTVTTRGYFIGITALILLFLIYFWGRARNLWQRYRTTHKLEKSSFIYADYIIWFVTFSVLLIILFQKKSIPKLSLEFKNFISINFIIIITWVLASYFYKKKKKEKKVLDIDIYSLSDEAIQFAQQDLLGREKFLEDLYKGIINIHLVDSFVFGLYGSWGEGKTSIINLLINKFKNNENFLIVNFNPWQFTDEKAILTAFYKQVEEVICNKFIFLGLKKTFAKYQKIILSGISYAGIRLNLIFKEKNLEDIRERIESYITQTKKKILIIIDDIDRLQPNEIIMIFKLVRLNANFKNTIFLLSFDPKVILNYFRENMKADPEFLEKVIQKPVQLPAIEQRNIDHFLDRHIGKLFDDMRIPPNKRENFNENFSYIYLSQIRNLFKTLRHAKRYLNGLRSTLPPIKNEINLYDFFIIELIRIFYPKVYSDIWRNPWFYIPSNWGYETYLLSPFFGLRDDEKYSRIKEHIETLIKDEKEKEVLKELLKDIFFIEVKNALDNTRANYNNVARTYRAEKRITHPESFKKYFMLKVSPLKISDEFMETTLDLWNSTEKNNIEGIIEETIFEIQKDEKLLDLFKKLLLFIDKIKQEIAFEIIKVLYKNADKFSKKGTENLWNSEYDTAKNLMMWLINDKIEMGKIQKVLEDVILETPYIPFAVSVVLSCKKERGGSLFNIYNSIKIEELQNIIAERLKVYFIDKNRDIFDELREESEWNFVLYQWATNWMTFNGKNNQIVNAYVISLIKVSGKKFAKFLMAQGQRTPLDTLTFNLSELDRVYNLTELHKLAEKFKNESSLSREERDIIKIFLKLYEDK